MDYYLFQEGNSRTMYVSSKKLKETDNKMGGPFRMTYTKTPKNCYFLTRHRTRQPKDSEKFEESSFKARHWHGPFSRLKDLIAYKKENKLTYNDTQDKKSVFINTVSFYP